MWETVKSHLNLKGVITLIVVAALGVGLGTVGSQRFLEDEAYTPVTYASVGVVTNTVPGVEGNALYPGETLRYSSVLCLNEKEQVRVAADGQFRQFEPKRSVLKDPLYEDLRLNLPAGCTRNPTASVKLPSFVTPGEWSWEVKISVLQGDKVTQVVNFTTTRFTVLPAPTATPAH